MYRKQIRQDSCGHRQGWIGHDAVVTVIAARFEAITRQRLLPGLAMLACAMLVSLALTNARQAYAEGSKMIVKSIDDDNFPALDGDNQYSQRHLKSEDFNAPPFEAAVQDGIATIVLRNGEVVRAEALNFSFESTCQDVAGHNAPPTRQGGGYGAGKACSR